MDKPDGMSAEDWEAKPNGMSAEEWEAWVVSGWASSRLQWTNTTPVLPPELRVATEGWNHLLDEWEQQALLLYKKEFFRCGVEYVSLRGFLDHRVDEQIRLRRYEEFVYDRIPFPAENEFDRIAGEKRLREYRDRLRRLVEISGIELPVNALALMRDSLRYPPAAEADIQAAESRLGLRFPPSYREFLGISNGWLMEEYAPVWPVEKVLPLREFSPKYLQHWLEHEFLHNSAECVVTPEPLGAGETFVTQDLDIPTACLKQALVIGYEKTDSAFLILDPTVIDERGEWRAMTLFRYEYSLVGRDFARLMEILYRMNTRREAT